MKVVSCSSLGQNVELTPPPNCKTKPVVGTMDILCGSIFLKAFFNFDPQACDFWVSAIQKITIKEYQLRSESTMQSGSPIHAGLYRDYSSRNFGALNSLA